MTHTAKFADTADLVARITILAIEISKAGKFHVFAQYSGHVDWFEVRVLPGNQVYERGAQHNKLFETCIHLYRDTESVRRRLESAYAALQEFAKQDAA